MLIMGFCCVRTDCETCRRRKTKEFQSMSETTTNNNGLGGGELASIFLKSANDLSHLHAESLKLHKLSFEAGQRHSLERLYEWMMMKMQEGISITPPYVLAYLQEELNKRTTGCQESEMDLSPNNKEGHQPIADDHEMDSGPTSN